eukprot:3110375-Rhodomonas_salina.1
MPQHHTTCASRIVIPDTVAKQDTHEDGREGPGGEGWWSDWRGILFFYGRRVVTERDSSVLLFAASVTGVTYSRKCDVILGRRNRCVDDSLASGLQHWAVNLKPCLRQPEFKFTSLDPGVRVTGSASA